MLTGKTDNPEFWGLAPQLRAGSQEKQTGAGRFDPFLWPKVPRGSFNFRSQQGNEVASSTFVPWFPFLLQWIAANRRAPGGHTDLLPFLVLRQAYGALPNVGLQVTLRDPPQRADKEISIYYNIKFQKKYYNYFEMPFTHKWAGFGQIGGFRKSE